MKCCYFLVEALQKCVHLADLEKVSKDQYLAAKNGVHEAENEPSKVSPKSGVVRTGE